MAVATVTVNGVDYTVQSGKNFCLGFVHYYVRLMHMDGINYTERTVYGLAVYSGNASISFSCIDDAGNESRITATESTTGDHYAASPATLTSKLGRYGPVEISGFLEGTVFIGETYEVPYEDWAHDLNAGQLIGFTEAMAQMPPVCNAQFPIILIQPTGKTVAQGAAVTLTCTAQVTDGGVLSYVWHGDNTVQGQGPTFTPPTDAVGEKYYQCVVTNTLTAPGYGTDSSSTASEMAKVTVTTADTGGDTDQPEEPEEPDTPDQPETVEKFPILDCINGLVMALCGRPIQWPSREPVAYLFNGVRLPDIFSVYTPEQQETHPYATMVTSTDADIETHGRALLAYLILSTMPLIRQKGSFIYYELAAAEDGSVFRYLINTVDGVTDEDWKRDADKDGNYAAGDNVQAITLSTIRWANYDIYRDDGTIYLAASDPVPVYE